jgi:hypothetical protein
MRSMCSISTDASIERDKVISHAATGWRIKAPDLVTAPAYRPGQSRTISTNFQLLPIKERAVSAQKSEMVVRFSTSGTGATTCSHCAQRGLKQPRLHLTRHHERPASEPSIPGPSPQDRSKQERLACDLASPKLSGPYFCAPQGVE